LLSGEDFRARLNLDDCTTVDMLAARWTQEQSLLDVYLHSLTDADLAGMVRDADDDADQAVHQFAVACVCQFVQQPLGILQAVLQRPTP
jgi:hypothetical protein